MTTIKKTHGVYLGASTMYPTLKTLERKSLLKSEWDIDSRPPKKIYKMTKTGIELMENTVSSLNQLCKTLQLAEKNKTNIDIGLLIK